MQLLATTENLTLKAPTGGVTYGVPLKIGKVLVVPATTAEEGQAFTAETKGVFVDFPLKDGETPTYDGEYAYFDGADFCVNKPTAPFDTPIGAFIVEHQVNALYLPGIIG